MESGIVQKGNYGTYDNLERKVARIADILIGR